LHRFGLGRIALRQLRSRPAPAIAEGLILAMAATLVAAVVAIQSNVTDEGLRGTIAAAGNAGNVLIEQNGLQQPAAFDAFQKSAAARVRAQLGNTVTAGAEFGQSLSLAARTINGVVQDPPAMWNISMVTYAGITSHAHIVSGRWESDVPAGADWEFTASAHATDATGVPLGLVVGGEYCFQRFPGVRPGGDYWCGRLVGTWLPNSVADPYWAGAVPNTDVVVTHNSFFEILGLIPKAVGGAGQQYTANTAGIRAADTGRMITGVNQLRGFFSVSSDGVFVSGLDATVKAFMTRQDSAAGPILVAVLGLLVIAITAMGFAAMHFMQSHRAEVALWRARGWSRPRVWALFSTEFTILAAIAVPLAVVASASISAAADGASALPTTVWQRVSAVAVPAVAAEAVFLAVLVLLAAALSSPALSARRQTRATTRARTAQRWALDVALLAAGVGILWFVHGGLGPTGETQTNVVAFVLLALAVGLIVSVSLRLVGFVARLLTIRDAVGGRLARWEIERGPRQYARLSLLVTLAVAVGVFATTYTSSDNAGAVDRADYMVGADMRATVSRAGSPPDLAALTASLPSGVRAAQVFRDDGEPGQSGSDTTVLGVQGTGFWNIAYSRPDFASQSLRSLTAAMNAADPDGALVSGSPHALSVSVYSSGVSARIGLEVTDAAGDLRDLPLGTAAGPGWIDMSASLAGVRGPIRVRALTISPVDISKSGDVAFSNLRTGSGSVIESFASDDNWWEEAFAPDPAVAPLEPSLVHSQAGQFSVDIPISTNEVRLLPPPSARPLPVLMASQTLASLGLSIGQAFPFRLDGVNVEMVAVGSFDEFPTYYPAQEDFLVAPLYSLLARLGRSQVTNPWANELWMSVPDNDAAAVTSKVNADLTLLNSLLFTDSQARSQALSDPLRRGFAEELGIGALVALLVVVINFGLHFLAEARNRATQFAIMRANGVPHATLRNALIAEQLAVLISGCIAGACIGLAVCWAVLPVFHLGNLPGDLTPPSLFHVDPLILVAVVLGTGALALVTGAAVAARGARVNVMSAIRALS
jgi:hypothetical protein